MINRIRYRLTGYLMLLIVISGMTVPSLQAYDEKKYARAIRFKICINCDLYQANFSGIDLSYANFSGSNLISANFQKATLYQVNFEGANISGANFDGAMWINGKICQDNSIGRCNFSDEK